MSNLAYDTRTHYSDDDVSAEPAEAAAVAPAEPEDRRAPVAVGWLITAAASLGLWAIIAEVGRRLLT